MKNIINSALSASLFFGAAGLSAAAQASTIENAAVTTSAAPVPLLVLGVLMLAVWFGLPSRKA